MEMLRESIYGMTWRLRRHRERSQNLAKRVRDIISGIREDPQALTTRSARSGGNRILRLPKRLAFIRLLSLKDIFTVRYFVKRV